MIRGILTLASTSLVDHDCRTKLEISWLYETTGSPKQSLAAAADLFMSLQRSDPAFYDIEVPTDG